MLALEYRSMWVSAGAHDCHEQITRLCTRASHDGWALHSVVFGERYWTPPGNGPNRVEDGWLVLFSRPAAANGSQ